MRILIEEWGLFFVLAVQVALVCLGFLSRYLFSWSISFTEEISRYLLLWLACLGFSACLAREEMIRFTLPSSKCPRYHKACRIAAFCAVLLFLMIVIFSSAKMILLQWRMGSQTAVMGWPIIWVSLALPIGASLMLWRLIGRKRPFSST